MNTWKRFLNRAIYNNDHELLASPAKKNMDRFIVQGMLGTAFATFSGGIFLLGYLLHLGAPDALASYVPLLPNICGIFLIFFSTLVDRKESRKRLFFCVNIMCKIFLISIAFVPLFVPKPYDVPIIFVFLIIGQAIAGINGIAFNAWFNDIIPGKVKGRYFSTRQIFCVLMSAVLPVCAAFLIDNMTNQYLAFVILFLCAAFTGIIELLVFSLIDDVKIKVSEAKPNVLKAFATPLRDKPFRIYVLITCLFHFFVHISASFSQTFLLRYLHVDYTYINVMSTINFALQMLIFYKFWGMVTDRLGSNFTLAVSMAIYTLDLLAWVFIDKQTLAYIYPALQLIAAIEGSGFTVSLYTRRYEIIPQEGRSVYDSFFVCCLGVTLLAAPFVGNILRGVFGSLAWLNDAISFGSFRAVYLISTISLLILTSLYLVYAKKQDTDGIAFQKGTMRQLKLIFLETLGLRR